MQTDELPSVYILDDEPEVRHCLEQSLRWAGHRVKSFSSAEQFLDVFRLSGPACLVLDIRLQGMSGLDLLSSLRRDGHQLPTIVVSGDVSVSETVRAMQEGAISVLPKPFDDGQFLQLVESALQQSQREWAAEREWRVGMKSLTYRERQVASLMLDGKSTKQIARLLHISRSTVDKHRLRVFSKLRVDTPAMLLLKASRASRVVPATHVAKRAQLSVLAGQGAP